MADGYGQECYEMLSATAVPEFNCYLFTSDHAHIMPFAGDLAGLIHDFGFVGYLVVGPEPTLSALYCSASLVDTLKPKLTLFGYMETVITHHSVIDQVHGNLSPIYRQVDEHEGIELDLEAKYYRKSSGNVLRTVYEYPRGGEKCVVNPAIYPLGYFAHHHLDVTLAEMSDLFAPLVAQPATLAEMPDFFAPSVAQPATLADMSDYFPFEPEPSTIPESWMASAIMTPSCGTGGGPYLVNAAPPKTPRFTLTFLYIAQNYPLWKDVLVHVRLLIRVAIFCGECPVDPFSLTKAPQVDKVRFTRDIFHQSLTLTGIRHDELERVISANGLKTLTEHEILTLASRWLSEFISDAKRRAVIGIGDSRPNLGFGIADKFGIILIETLLDLLRHFTQPVSSLLPIERNGFAWFLRQGIAASLIYSFLYRSSRSSNTRLIVADLRPSAFRGPSCLPVDILAFMGVSCYDGLRHLLARFVKKMRKQNEPTGVIPKFPHASQVFLELRLIFPVLLEQRDDPMYPAFMADMENLCNLVETDVCVIARD